jgi:hypothetical protein
VAFVRFLLPKQLRKAKNNIFDITSGFAKAFQTPTTITHVAQYIGGLNQ